MNALTRSNRYSPNLRNDLLIPFEQVFDSFFTDFFKGTSAVDKVKAQSGYPKMDVFRQDDQLVVRAAIPGVKPEDVKVEMLDDQTVEISGKYSEEYNTSEENYQLRELTKRAFARQLSFSEKVGDPASATVKDGVLTLAWKTIKPKEPEKRLVQITQG
mgnify:CR=1 FL=1